MLTEKTLALQVINQEIQDAIYALQSASLPISVNTITLHLTNFIVDCYYGVTSLFVYKTDWSNKIACVLSSLKINYNKSRPNWEKIAMLIHDKKLGICRSKNTTVSSNSISSDIQLKLLPADITKILTIFENLDTTKMWTLSTGTVVEKKMKEFALVCNYEHPVHSLILDTSDICWKNYFTSDELDEIKTMNMKNLCDLPDSLNAYTEAIRQVSDITELKKRLSQELEDPACEWIRSTMLDYLRLFKYNYMPLTDQTEGDMLRRVWLFIDTLFDDSKIRCRGGEKSSKASSASRNQDRTLSAVDKMARKLVGRKVDMLYMQQRLEYGCCECGRFDDPTKEMNDGGFKMVKVLKDMLYRLYQSAPSTVRDLVLPGFLLFETKFTLVVCDSPAGYVCRINKSSPLDLPADVDEMNNQLLSILRVVYQARLFMENSQKLVRQSPVVLDFGIVKHDSVLPCFYSEANKQKRQRNSQITED
ncbi:unnamed protein product [Rhizopus stolonifer]